MTHEKAVDCNEAYNASLEITENKNKGLVK